MKEQGKLFTSNEGNLYAVEVFDKKGTLNLNGFTFPKRLAKSIIKWLIMAYKCDLTDTEREELIKTLKG